MEHSDKYFKLSREGYIYILDNASLVQLGKITIIQKSTDGEIQENPTVSFNEADVPIFIPLPETRMTTPPASSEIDLYTGKFKDTWMDKQLLAPLLPCGRTGNMNLAVVGSNETGNSVVRFKIRDKTYDVTISGPTSKIYGYCYTIPIKIGIYPGGYAGSIKQR